MEHRLRGEQEQLARPRLLVVAERDAAGRPARLQRCFQLLVDGEIRLRFLARLARRLRVLEPALALLLQRLEILELQLGVDHFLVAQRVHRPVDVHHVRILEAAQHVRDRVHLADVGEELVAEPLAFRGAAHQPGDVQELEGGVGGLLRFVQGGEPVDAIVGNRDHSDVRVLGRERIVRGEHGSARERVEQRALAHVGQTDDADGKTHGACDLHQRGTGSPDHMEERCLIP